MGKTIQVSGFPCTVSAEAAKTYLEQYSGRGTVHALKMREFRNGTRSSAIVQFTTSEGADLILSLASTRLWYGSSYLKARMMDSDIVPRPRTYQHSIHDITLYFGCQISNDKFLAFRKASNVSFNIGFGQRKLHFLLAHGRKEYELELSFDDVWQIQLRHPRGCPSKYLLIQIFIPHGRALMGCLDETGTLEYGQVFVQVSGSRFQNSSNDFLSSSGFGSERFNYVITESIVVAKNPCLYPGDVRKLRAVDVPALHHMVDCVVFPQKGKRPHTDECSGSDLDGDIYFVCWDPELIPPRQVPPMDYTPAETVVLDHNVTIEEVEEYFTNYIVNDSLGIISHAQTVHADRELEKAMSAPCVELAKLASVAVDFPKTGVPAEMPPRLRVKEYPDFMEKPDKPTYESQNVIGKLLREVKDRAPHTSSIRSFTREVARRSYDRDMEYDGFQDYLDDAAYYKSQYDYKLGNLMDYYGIKTEAEILSGNIMKMSKSFNRRKDAEAITMAVRSLRKEARSWFKKGGDLRSGTDDEYAKASAWYHVAYHPSYWGCYNEGMNRDHFISFPWCIYDKLIRIKKNKTRNRRDLDLSSFEGQFYGLSFR